MRGADGDAAHDGGEGQRQGGAGFGAGAVDRPQAADALPHGLDDAPAAEKRAQPHGHVTGEHDLGRHLIGSLKVAAAVAGGDQENEDHAHGFLGVVAAVPEAEKPRREELQHAKQIIDPPR